MLFSGFTNSKESQLLPYEFHMHPLNHLSVCLSFYLRHFHEAFHMTTHYHICAFKCFYLSCCPIVVYRSSLVTLHLPAICLGELVLNSYLCILYTNPQNVVYLFSDLKAVLRFSIILCCFALSFTKPLKVE